MPRKKTSSAKARGGKRAGRAAPKKRATAAAKPAVKKGHGGTAPGTYVCPECGFVAKHAMGLGRHRSTRHGVQSARAQRLASAGDAPKRRGRPPKSARPTTPAGVAPPPAGWLTRRQAAEVGGVHYNTVRIWERQKLFDSQQRGRDVLIDEAGFRKVLAEKQSGTAGGGAGAARSSAVSAASSAGPGFEVTELLARLDALADGLEALARQVRPRKRRGRPPKR